MDEFEDLSASLAEIVAARGSSCLLLMISDADALYPAAVLRAMDRQDPDALYLVFSQPCSTTVAYMDAIVEQVRVWLEGLCASDGASSCELPEAAVDPRDAPSERLTALVEYVRELVGEDASVVWGFLPGSIGDVEGYRELVRPLVPLAETPQRIGGQHFVLREPLDGSAWADHSHDAGVDEACLFRFEASYADITDALAAAAADPSNTDDERMAALSQLAGIDVAHRRYPAALAKYDALQHYYGATDNADMRALAFGGIGDASMRAEHAEAALAAYRRGLALCVPTQAFPTILVLLMSAGTTCLALEDWAEAERYFGCAIDVAAKLLNVVALCDSHEDRGIARRAQSRHKDAVQDWIIAKDLAKRYGYAHRFRSAVDWLIEIYEAADLQDNVGVLEREKAEVERGTR